ncbi:MAG: DUF2182 domain-containing protein [Acuticoccus sp.]
MTGEAPGGVGRLVEKGLLRDRLIMVLGLLALTLLAWAYLLTGAGTGMSVRAMTTWSFPPPMRPAMAMAWSPAYWLIMFLMWWIMMIAMMTPSAAPMVLLHARVSRHQQARGRMAVAPVPTAAFFFGYLAAWAGFSALATVAQWSLERAGLVHGMLMWSSNRTLSAGLLLAAGIYQLSPWKRVCLEHCRSPAEYLSRHWRPGDLGAFRMGLTHGAYCLGCCWVLMALLFVGGTMNLVWIAGLGALVLGEKLLPFGSRLAQGLGVVMIVAGAALLLPV